MAAKVVGKRFLREDANRICRYPEVKSFVEKFLACFVSKINTFYAEIQDGRQKWWEKDFGKKT